MAKQNSFSIEEAKTAFQKKPLTSLVELHLQEKVAAIQNSILKQATSETRTLAGAVTQFSGDVTFSAFKQIEELLFWSHAGQSDKNGKCFKLVDAVDVLLNCSSSKCI